MKHLHPNAKKVLAESAGYQFKDKSPTIFGNIPWEGFFKKSEGLELFIALNDYNPNDITTSFCGKYVNELIDSLIHEERIAVLDEMEIPFTRPRIYLLMFIRENLEDFIVAILKVKEYIGEVYEDERALKARTELDKRKLENIMKNITPKIESPSKN